MKIDIRNDVMDKLNEMGINATEQAISSIAQRVYEEVITSDYYERIEEAIKAEHELIDVKINEDPEAKFAYIYETEPANNKTSFEDPVKKDIQKNLIRGMYWWL